MFLPEVRGGRAVTAQLLEFGDVTVDLRRVEVRRAGAAVPLEPKSFDVLRHLVENRDRLVTKEELLEVVWRDTFVTPNVLTRAVAQLRKGLGDDAFEARYIETVARRGYRFIAPAGFAGDGHAASVATSRRHPLPSGLAGGGAGGRGGPGSRWQASRSRAWRWRRDRGWARQAAWAWGRRPLSRPGA